MSRWLSALPLTFGLALAACGGGGNGGGSGGSGSTPPPIASPGTPTPPPTSDTCSLRSRQDWAADRLREWYLFPETLPGDLNPANFATVQAYVDALTANARALRRDRFFTHITSIAQENAFFSSGSNAGFGVRLATDTAARRLFISEAFEGAPALNAGIDRGTEILAIGESESNLRTVSAIIAAEGSAGVSNALGPADPGVTRVLRISNASGTRNVTVTKADFTLLPVSNRYGARVIEDAGRRVGYLNLRTFISTADPALRQAFADFKSKGITEVIVDFRYNGGGLVSTGELMTDLLGGNRSSADVLSHTAFRPEKSANDKTRRFSPQAESIAPTRIAFIGTRGTASASELVINALIPYLRSNLALVGTNTFGKPVGQIGLDRAACDDRLRIVAFATQNAARQGDYYDGLADKVEASCQAGDDLTRQLGDPQEASTRQALDFLAGRPCTRISTGATTQSLGRTEARRDLLTPDQPTVAQREVPGLF